MDAIKVSKSPSDDRRRNAAVRSYCINGKRLGCYIAIYIVLGGCADSLSGNSTREKALFGKIKVGMKVEEVNKILGKPDGLVIDSITKQIDRYYFTRNKSAMRSSMPWVTFDSTGSVIFSSYGDGG